MLPSVSAGIMLAAAVSPFSDTGNEVGGIMCIGRRTARSEWVARIVREVAKIVLANNPPWSIVGYYNRTIISNSGRIL